MMRRDAVKCCSCRDEGGREDEEERREEGTGEEWEDDAA